MPNIDKRLMGLSLRRLGELSGVTIEIDEADRAGFDALLGVPIRLLAREFRTRAALHRFVAQKLEQAEDRARVRRIAAIFKESQ